MLGRSSPEPGDDRLARVTEGYDTALRNPLQVQADDGAMDGWARDDAEPSCRYGAPVECPEAADAAATPAPPAQGQSPSPCSIAQLPPDTMLAYFCPSGLESVRSQLCWAGRALLRASKGEERAC